MTDRERNMGRCRHRPGSSLRALGAAVAMVALAWVTQPPAALAHHSFGIFDMTKPTNLNGTVSEFQFVNPHGYVTLVVPATPTAVQWRIEVSNPNQLIRFGWKKDILKPGDKIGVLGFPARDGTNFLLGREFTLSDGRKVLGAPRGAPAP